MAELSDIRRLPVKVSLSSAVMLPGSFWKPLPMADAGSKAISFASLVTVPHNAQPWAFDGDGESRSLWFTHTATEAQTLTVEFDCDFDFGLEAWDFSPGDLTTDVSILGYATNGGLEVSLSTGQTALIRVHPLAAPTV